MLRSMSVLVISVAALFGLASAPAYASTTGAASKTVTGLPALLIIIAILAVLIIGVVAIVKFVVRKGRDAL